MKRAIKILLIESNALLRKTITEYFSQSSDFHLRGVAHNIKMAEQKCAKELPDIAIADFAQHSLEELDAFSKLFAGFNTPVAFLSGHAEETEQLIITQFKIPQWAVIRKPTLNLVKNIRFLLPELEQSIRRLNAEELLKLKTPLRRSNREEQAERPTGPSKTKPKRTRSCDVIAIGASTGGTSALLSILSSLSSNVAPILVVVHMPAAYTGAFASRLNSLYDIFVCEAEENLALRNGMAVIAAGDRHLELVASQDGYRVHMGGYDPVNGHCPSVDELFFSVAQTAGVTAIGILLTGMGKDGAKGLLKMQQQGGHTIAQDEESSVVFGMPKAAIDLGAANEVLSLHGIAQSLGQRFELPPK